MKANYITENINTLIVNYSANGVVIKLIENVNVNTKLVYQSKKVIGEADQTTTRKN